MKLVDYDKESLYKVAATLLYEHTDWSLEEITKSIKKRPKEQIEKIRDRFQNKVDSIEEYECPDCGQGCCGTDKEIYCDHCDTIFTVEE